MGAEPYWYFVDYEENYNEALQKLREREFNAGRYFPVMDPVFPVTDSSPAPGAQHTSIEEAMEEMEGEGTKSILDIFMVSSESDLCVAGTLTPEELKDNLGSEKPTKEMVEEDGMLLGCIDRGSALCIPIYEDDKPTQLLFVGYSFD